jgi:dTDP-glucose 4,6-dehydratase
LEKLIPQFVNRLRNGDSVPIYGDGMNVRDWLYVNDHCEGIYIALTKGTPGEIYNIGGGTELTNLELTKMLLKFFDKGLEFIRHVEDRLGHDRRYSVNYSKIASLGYSPSPDFLGNLTTALEWYITENDK